MATFTSRFATLSQETRSKLFAKSDENLELYLIRRDRAATHPTHASKLETLQDFRSCLEQLNTPSCGNIVLLLTQDFSWGRLRIGQEAFVSLCASIDAAPSIIEIVSAFGFRSDEGERRVFGARTCSWLARDCTQQHAICYVLMYATKHGRDLKDPWSLRQLGIYHQTEKDGKTSRWIMIDLASNSAERLTNVEQQLSTGLAMGYMSSEIATSTATWTEYIEFLQAELTEFDHKACYSSTESASDCKYNVAGTDLQQLHMLEAKIDRAAAAVSSNLNISRSCEKFYSMHHQRCYESKESDGESFCLLQESAANLERHESRLQMLRCRLHSTLDMISRSLECRNGQSLQTANHASYKMLQMLVDITNQSREQQATLAVILSTGQADSTMLKMLSIVATVCLPASLVAAIFQSNLIQPVDSRQQEANTHLVLSDQFWIYVVITIPLTLLTLAWTWYLNRTSRKSFRST